MRADQSNAFSVRVEYLGETVVLSVFGEIDIVTAPRLSESISAAFDRRPTGVVVDLSGVDFLASAGLSVLIESSQKAGDDVRFRLVAAGRSTFRPMELTGITETITIYPSRERALAED